MAKLVETALYIKASRMIRDDEEEMDVLTRDLIAQLTEVVEQLAGEGTLVEITKE
jgi:hypothetical protein